MEASKKQLGQLVAITGSKPPYIYDIPQLMALPSGSEFRFRYQRKWVADAIKSDISRDKKKYVGWRIAICFHSSENKMVMQIRSGTVLSLEIVGPMVFLRFVLEGYTACEEVDLENHSKFESSVEASKISLASLAERLCPNLSEVRQTGEIPPNSHLSLAVGQGSESILAADHDGDAWTRLVSVLKSEKSLLGVPFFKIENLSLVNGGAVGKYYRDFSGVRSGGSYYKPIVGEQFRLRIIEWSDDSTIAEQRDYLEIKPIYDAERLVLYREFPSIVGKYDVVEYRFISKVIGETSISLCVKPSASLSLSRQDDGGSTPVQSHWRKWPTILVADLPLIIRHNYRSVFFASISILFGCAGYLLAGACLQSYSIIQRMVELISIGLLASSRTFFSGLESLFYGFKTMNRFNGGKELWIKSDE